MGLRGTGSFVSIGGVEWKVDIEVEGYEGKADDISFPADEPLVIEWPETDRLDPWEGSTATLRIISDTDRQWTDLYSIERAKVRLMVYRNGASYWYGTLDTEFYEEPYESLSGYEVNLTFSDLAVLEHIDYDLTGAVTLAEILSHGLQLAGLDPIYNDLTTTIFEDGETVTLTKLCARSDNFYDEEGKPMNYKEVITGILQPLGLKLRQTGYAFTIYDLNGAYGATEPFGYPVLPKKIEWNGDSQTMGMAEVAQKITVSFSPYGGTELLTDELEYTGKTSSDVANTTVNNPNDPDYGEYYTFFNDYRTQMQSSAENSANEYIDFNLFLSADKGKGLGWVNPAARYAQFVPVFGDAAERAAVAWYVAIGQCSINQNRTPKAKLSRIINPSFWRNSSHGSSTVIFRSKRVYVAGCAADGMDTPHYLRLVLPLLMDARYNPFDSTADNDANEKDHDYYYKVRTGYVFIPVSVTIYDSPEGGNALCHYDNHTAAQTYGTKYAGNGSWQPGEAAVGDLWLEYYSTSDLKEDSGIRGWKNNRTLIGRPELGQGRPSSGGGKGRYSGLTAKEKKLDDGEYITWPEQGGWLEIAVYEGYRGFDYDQSDSFDLSPYWDGVSQNGVGVPVINGSSEAWLEYPMRRWLRWMMYGAPTVDIVSGIGNLEATDVDDVEYTGWIERSAKEGLDISTIYGTVSSPTPAARGAIIRKSNGELVSRLTRAGVTDAPERLLIGTAMSQYSDRHLKFSGEALLTGTCALTCTERLHGDRVFWIAADRQNAITDTTETTIIELSNEVYKAIEEVEE
ncbi:MAG: hypothetical protein NC230_09260 [Bacteroides sp.]|nr:hypothetical protein [Bacteroides sp.]